MFFQAFLLFFFGEPLSPPRGRAPGTPEMIWHSGTAPVGPENTISYSRPSWHNRPLYSYHGLRKTFLKGQSARFIGPSRELLSSAVRTVATRPGSLNLTTFSDSLKTASRIKKSAAGTVWRNNPVWTFPARTESPVNFLLRLVTGCFYNKIIKRRDCDGQYQAEKHMPKGR